MVGVYLGQAGPEFLNVAPEFFSMIQGKPEARELMGCQEKALRRDDGIPADAEPPPRVVSARHQAVDMQHEKPEGTQWHGCPTGPPADGSP